MQLFSGQLTYTSCSYDKPPLYDVALEEFEACALDRLRILAEIESSFARNRLWEELKSVTITQYDKYLPLHATTATTTDRESERRKDHLSHYVLRLAFCRSYVPLWRVAFLLNIMLARICGAVLSRQKRHYLGFDMKLMDTRNESNS